MSKTAALDFTTKAPHKMAIDAFRATVPAKATTILQKEGRVHQYADREYGSPPPPSPSTTPPLPAAPSLAHLGLARFVYC